jgi:hypothetical protein
MPWGDQLRISKRDLIARNLRCLFLSFATVVAFLFLTLSAFSQESQQLPPASAAAHPTQDKSQNQSPSQNNSLDQKSAAQNDAEKEKKKSDRMFYVMPNYLTVDNQSNVPPINWKEKFAITLKGSFDPYEFVIVGVVAGIRQAEDSYPAFGQGAAGYGSRYGTAFADQVIGNIMVGGVYPSILKTDPRYFRLGTGTYRHRFWYAFSRVLITRKDSGGRIFNIPEFAGNGTAIAISRAYYPSSDRTASSAVADWGLQMGIDAFGNQLKEFWPDIHERLRKKKNAANQP